MRLPRDVQILAEGVNDDFETDNNAEQGTYGWHLHRARVALESHRGKSTDGKPKVQFEIASNIVSHPSPSMQWLVQGVIPDRSVGVISAEPKASKTWAEIALALAVANAVPAFGEFIVSEAGDAFLIALEDARQSMRTRLIATAVGMGLDPVKATARIHIQCRGTINLQKDADVCAIIAAVWVSGRKPRALFIDPLRDAHAAAEDKSDEMTPVMHQLRAIRDILDCSVVFIHHTSKAGPDSAKRRAGQRMRGSTAVHGAIDCGFYMSLKDNTECSWTNRVEVETKNGRSGGVFELRLDLEDDANREATRATWTFSREDGRGNGSGADELKAAILEALRTAPASGSALAENVGKRLGAVLKACTILEDEGHIAKQGRKWQTLPTLPSLPGEP